MTSVKLYVYDLSQGMAKQMSLGLTGRQIDGIWHTSVVVFGQEYFYGQGIMNALPGTTHHGQPIQIVDMGETYLTEDIFIEYLNSISSSFTAEKYHLLDFNCNTFTNDVCQFLTGEGIPDHITDLPADFLNTPFGQSMRPMIESMFGPSTHARQPSSFPPQSAQQTPSSISMLNNVASAALSASPATTNPVQTISNLSALENLIKSQRGVLAFFTSATCPPCRVIEPDFIRKLETINQDRIKVVGAKIDTHVAFDAAQKYGVRATPTFMAFVDGKKFAEFSGANFAELNSTVDFMIFTMYPPHCHRKLNLRAMFDISSDPILFTNHGNLEAILKKLNSFLDEANVKFTEAEQKTLQDAKTAIENPQQASSALDVKQWDKIVATLTSKLAINQQFPLLDLFRSLVIVREVGNFYTHDCTTIVKVLENATSQEVAKPTLLMTLRLLCNTFSHPVLARTHFSSSLPDSHRSLATSLLIKSLLSDDALVRQTASSLAFNFSCVTAKDRLDREAANESPRDDEDWEVEVVSAVTNALEKETEGEIVYRLISTLSKFLFLAPKESPLPSLVSILDIQAAIKEKECLKNGKVDKTKITSLAREIDELVSVSLQEME